MTRYLVIGDTHADLNFAARMTRLAQSKDIDTILQVGDFGYWPRLDEAEREAGVRPKNFHGELSKYSAERGVTWYFIPGNHEDWDRLDEIEDNSDEHFFCIAPNIWYTGKVNVWEWGGIHFASAGGAFSVDKNWRTAGWDWFEQETMSYRDFDTLAATIGDTKIDVLLTHDAPTWLEYPGRLLPVEESLQHRKAMDAVWEMTRPFYWFHGHYHKYMEYYNAGTYVYGLDCNYYDHGGMFNAGVILNTDEFSVQRIEQGDVNAI